MAAKGNKGLGILSRIEQKEDAVKVVKAASLAFFIVAGLLVMLSFIYGPALLIDAGAYFVLGIFLRQFKSRVIAILVLLLAIVTTVVGVGKLFGAGIDSGIYIIVAVIVLWAAIRAVEATFKLRGGPPAGS